MDVHDDLGFPWRGPSPRVARSSARPTAVSVATVSALTSLAAAAPDAPVPAVVFMPDVQPPDRAREALQAILAALDAAAARRRAPRRKGRANPQGLRKRALPSPGPARSGSDSGVDHAETGPPASKHGTTL